MAHYRITIRYGRPQRYHVVDLEATDLRAATRLAAERFPPGDAARDTDLLEIRRLADPEARNYVDG